MTVRPRDRHLAGFERLAQGIEHRALKLRQLVEKQHAEMRQTDLARLRTQPATHQRRHRRTVMGTTVRPCPGHPPALQRPCDTRDHRNFERLGGRQLGQYARHTARHQRLARAGRAAHQHVEAD